MTATNDDLKTIEEKLHQADEKIETLKTSVTLNSRGLMNDSWWSATNAMTISSVILVFGLIVIVMASGLIKNGKEPEAILRVFGTILIIILAVFLIVAGYDDKQIAPAMGLLGTIAGYLLGKETKKKENEREEEQ